MVDESKLYMAFSNGLWYRATAFEGPENDHITAFFVDFGKWKRRRCDKTHTVRLFHTDQKRRRKRKISKEKTETIKGNFRFRSVCLDLKDSSTLSKKERESEIFSLIIVTAHCEK